MTDERGHRTLRLPSLFLPSPVRLVADPTRIRNQAKDLAVADHPEIAVMSACGRRRFGYRGVVNDDRLLTMAQRLATTLTPGDLDHTLSRITAAAVQSLPETDYASISILHADGRLETVAPTDDVLWGVDAAQYELREGPCYEAAADAVHVASPDLAQDERFPRYAVSAVAAGLRAQAGILLFDAPKSRGALNLYSENVGAFTDLGRLGELFRHQAAIAIDYAREIHNLREAVQTRSTRRPPPAGLADGNKCSYAVDSQGSRLPRIVQISLCGRQKHGSRRAPSSRTKTGDRLGVASNCVERNRL